MKEPRTDGTIVANNEREYLRGATRSISFGYPEISEHVRDDNAGRSANRSRILLSARSSCICQPNGEPPFVSFVRSLARTPSAESTRLLDGRRESHPPIDPDPDPDPDSDFDPDPDPDPDPEGNTTHNAG
ncbi:hypothetical protein K0M31_015618 [Melipona bicolor]|uniref:Uncharacterized protein n=1 Tax=Melipona bicolor TaxID=60889 RepID=A0AA40FFA3_9HYME|nr:hypothetical protein K0M31_015618 [Melipona bicolor]